MSIYGWIIDVDHVTMPDEHARYAASNGRDGLCSRVGWMGPRTLTNALAIRLQAGEGTPFRLYSDDETEGDTLDYEGRMIIIADDGDAELAPLDDLGRPDCGSTTICYFTDGVWQPI